MPNREDKMKLTLRVPNKSKSTGLIERLLYQRNFISIRFEIRWINVNYFEFCLKLENGKGMQKSKKQPCQ